MIKVSIKHNFGEHGYYVCDVIKSDKYKHANELVEAWQKAQACYLVRGIMPPCEWKVLEHK